MEGKKALIELEKALKLVSINAVLGNHYGKYCVKSLPSHQKEKETGSDPRDRKLSLYVDLETYSCSLHQVQTY